ncbi:hypothetical protein ScPMuIL_018435 [Solemya velum]
MEEKSTKFISRLTEDILAADLKWSLFVAALQSYRFDSVLRPYPAPFLKENGEKDIKSLERLADKLPGIQKVADSLDSLSSDLIGLLDWVLESKAFKLRTSQISEFERIKIKTGQTDSVPTPNFIFELQPSPEAESKFEQIRNGRQTMYAYHGSRVENFHSIIHNGLASHMNKTSVYGEGTYLSAELSVSLHYSPTGLGWEHSTLGHKLSCVTVCEMIDDPAVKCQVKGTDSKLSKSRAKAANAEGGEVPEKYYVVQNNDMLRVKYILVYAEKKKSARHKSLGQPSWFQQHKFLVMMTVYVFLLLLIGLCNSKSFQFRLKKFFKF